MTTEEKMSDPEYAAIRSEIDDLNEEYRNLETADSRILDIEFNLDLAHKRLRQRTKELEKFHRRKYSRKNPVAAALNDFECDKLDELCENYSMNRSKFIRKLILERYDEVFGGEYGSRK